MPRILTFLRDGLRCSWPVSVAAAAGRSSFRRMNPRAAVGLVRTACALLVAAAVVGGCAKQTTRPDILLVTIDTLRADHCSAYGYPVRTTPEMGPRKPRRFFPAPSPAVCS